MMQMTTCLVARDDVLSCEVGEDSAVLLDPTAGVYLGVDGPAALMWAMLAQPVSVAALCDAVQRDFEVTPERCEADVLAFVEDLRQRGLVSVVTA